MLISHQNVLQKYSTRLGQSVTKVAAAQRVEEYVRKRTTPRLPKEILVPVAKANPGLPTKASFSLACKDFAVTARGIFAPEGSCKYPHKRPYIVKKFLEVLVSQGLEGGGEVLRLVRNVQGRRERETAIQYSACGSACPRAWRDRYV